MGDKKKRKDKSRERQKSRDRDRDRDHARSRKKNKHRSHHQGDKKNKKKKRYQNDSQSSSYSSAESVSSQPRSYERSRSRNKKNKKKKSSKDKQEMSKSAALPFAVNQTSNILPVMRGPITPGLIIAPPAPPSTTPAALPKTKSKEYHIFKLFPKLPIGPVTIGRTIYCSKYMSKGFEQKLLSECCDDLEKGARLQNSKKTANMISKAKNQILGIQQNQNQAISLNQSQNQFHQLDISYKNALRALREKNVQIKKQELKGEQILSAL